MNVSSSAESGLIGLRQHAHMHMQQGAWSAAHAALDELLRLAPNDTYGHLLMAQLDLRNQQVDRARERLLSVASDGPEHPSLRVSLSGLLMSVGETRAARVCLPPSTRLCADGSTCIRLAHAYHRLGDQSEALAWMEAAGTLAQGRPEHRHFHAMLLQFVGRLDDAERVLDECLMRWPGFGHAALTRSRLRRQTPAANHVQFLEREAMRAASGSLERAGFLFALFKEHHDLGDHQRAWTFLARANALMHQRNPYDETSDRALADATLRYMRGRSLVGNGPTEPDGSGPRPIFIVGMPRSGTTLLERMLGNHAQVAAAGELTDLFYQWCRAAGVLDHSPEAHLQAIRHCEQIDARQLGQRYLEQTGWRANGRACFVDKMPNNFQFVGLIRRALPCARIIHVVREPMAVCFSNFKAMLGDASPHVYDQRLLARFWQRHDRLRQHWHEVVPDAMLDVAYEELVGQPEATMRRVLAFCGLDFQPDCVDPTRNRSPVATPSSAQVQDRLNRTGLDEWHAYALHLAPLRDALGNGEAVG